VNTETTETITNQDTLPTEPTHRWADDGGVLTEERQPEPESEPESLEPEPEIVEPETSMGSSMGTPMETPVETTVNHSVVREPLLSGETEQAFLSRWAEIQVGFVEDPAESVRDADRLVDEIAATLLSSLQARRIDLAVDWQRGSPGTEELRLALRRYRDFIGVILPK
jgi:hypothetical protein